MNEHDEKDWADKWIERGGWRKAVILILGAISLAIMFYAVTHYWPSTTPGGCPAGDERGC